MNAGGIGTCFSQSHCSFHANAPKWVTQLLQWAPWREMYEILLSWTTVWTSKALAALSQTLNKTHPHAGMHLGRLGLSDEQQCI